MPQNTQQFVIVRVLDRYIYRTAFSGITAMRGLEEGHAGVMLALDPLHVKYVQIEEPKGRMKTGPMDSDIVLTAPNLEFHLDKV